MNIITDIEEIKRLSKEKEEENWGFRSFLKSGVISSKKIDLITQKIYKQVAAKIDCKKCGNCCKEEEFVLKEPDIRKLAKRLDITAEELEKQHLVKNKDEKLMFNRQPCPLLQDKTCTVYEDRPQSCQAYPNILKKSLVPRLINVIHNCSVCPIVFNMYEELKLEIWSMNDGFDDFDEEYL